MWPVCDSRTIDGEMTFRDRLRRFWLREPAPDHPLSAEERDADRPMTAYDEVAETATEFVGGGFPDDDRR
jgi:hypothetical protein